MATKSLKELLNNAGFQTEDNASKEDSKSTLHRDKVIERSADETILKSIWTECVEVAKTQKDPTDELVFIPRARKEGEIDDFIAKEAIEGSGFIISCKDTEEMWYAPDVATLNKNFVYRDDLVIKEYKSKLDFINDYMEFYDGLLPGVITCKTCYILDNPGNETYEVYYESAYPSKHYGQATPRGTMVHKYKNRFHRDMAIMGLDNLYSDSSSKGANALVNREYKSNEAIIVSDGAWMMNVCSYCFFYLDNHGVTKTASTCEPSEEGQEVLIAEITGAYNALMKCYSMHKKKITYYYDNTSVIAVFNNRKTEYIDEVKIYKDLLKKMDEEGFSVNFVEIHPKTGENRETENKALMYFHNACDSECRLISDTFRKDYKSYAKLGSQDGKGVKEVLAGPAKKGNNNRQGGNKPNNNNNRQNNNNNKQNNKK